MRVGTQGLFRPYLKTFVPPFDPTDCPWVSEDGKQPFRVMRRCVQDRNQTLCIEVNSTFERPSVNMLPPGKCKTFKHYAEAVFLPYVINYRTQNVKRIDLVRDRYLENSLNQGTHEARGTGTRRRVCVCITEQRHIKMSTRHIFHVFAGYQKH